MKHRLTSLDRTGCNLIKLTITYCSLCPYVSKRPFTTSSIPSTPSTPSTSSTEISSDYQIYWFSHYLDLFFHKSNKKWKARLRKCPDWGGARLVEVGEGEGCPAGKMCQSDKDRRVRLLVKKTVEKKKGKYCKKKGSGEGEGVQEDLMTELARLEREYDVDVERVKVLHLERERWLVRVRKVVGEMEKVFESVAETLAGLEVVSRERSPIEKRKTWWSEEDVLLREK